MGKSFCSSLYFLICKISIFPQLWWSSNLIPKKELLLECNFFCVVKNLLIRSHSALPQISWVVWRGLWASIFLSMEWEPLLHCCSPNGAIGAGNVVLAGQGLCWWARHAQAPLSLTHKPPLGNLHYLPLGEGSLLLFPSRITAGRQG